MDLQTKLQGIVASQRAAEIKASGQLTLGELTLLVAAVDPSKPVVFDVTPFVPTDLRSFRGYYEELALGYQDASPQTAGELLAKLRAADGAVYQGYKGGNFPMRLNTPVNVANYGTSAGFRDDCSTIIVGVEETTDAVVIKTNTTTKEY